MPQRQLTLPVSGFRGGLNTEASSLTILPSEFATGTFNIELKNNGAVCPRRGVDFLSQTGLSSTMFTVRTQSSDLEVNHESPNSIHVRLKAPNGIFVNRVIVFINNTFRIYEDTFDALKDFSSPLQTIALTDRIGSNQTFNNMLFKATDNRVYFTGKHLQPGYLKVDTDNINLVTAFIDGYTRRSNNTSIGSRVSQVVSSVTRQYEALQSHIADSTNQPGIGAVWQRFWQRLDGPIPPTGVGAWATTTQYFTSFENLFDSTEVMDNTTLRPTAMEFFAGRLWLAKDNLLLFSQVIRDEDDPDNDVNRFHQFADPFDPNDSFIVDDDGGSLQLQGSGTIVQLLTQGRSVYIGTTVACRQITSPDGVFKAGNFSNQRVVTDAISSPTALVAVDQRVMVFGDTDIWLSPEPSEFAQVNIDITDFKRITEQVQTLGETTRTVGIKSLYSSIPAQSKKSSTSIYFSNGGSVYYFFNQNITEFDLDHNNFEQPGYYTNYLKFQVTNEEFTLHTMKDGGKDGDPYISVPFIAPSIQVRTDNIIVGNNNVLVGISQVIVPTSNKTAELLVLVLQRIAKATTSTGSAWNILTTNWEDTVTDWEDLTALGDNDVQIKAAFGRMETDNIVDWAALTEFTDDYKAKLVGGIQTAGDVKRKANPNYVFMVFDRVSNGGCFLTLSTQWSTTGSPKFGTPRQVYFPDRFGLDGTQFDKVWRKHRVKGRGNVFQFIFEKEPLKDFILEGFSEQVGV